MEHLSDWLKATYALAEPIQTRLLRSYSNDVYDVTSGNERFILKVYGIKLRRESDIQYEIALIQHLVAKGLRVAQGVAGKDGQILYRIATSKDEQYAVLFEYAEGYKPQPPFSNDLYVAFGRAIGQMHNDSDDFRTEYARTALDLTTVIDRSLEVALPHIKNANEYLYLQSIAQTVKNKMTALNLSQLDWGPIHGDATLDNLHVTDDGQIVLYDFDSGGPGWRAADLQGWAYHNTEYAEKWEAFKRGYKSVRELKAIDLEAARYLSVAWLIWGLQIDLEQRVLAQSEAKVAEYLTMQISAIREQAKLAFG
jgi:Ser/Thr protein kinase RdoA (MazF antagonist)